MSTTARDPIAADRWMAGAAHALVESIKPLIADKGGGVQGAVCADLMAIWLAGHAPELRDAVLELQVKLIRDLVPLYSRWPREDEQPGGEVMNDASDRSGVTARLMHEVMTEVDRRISEAGLEGVICSLFVWPDGDMVDRVNYVSNLPAERRGEMFEAMQQVLDRWKAEGR